MAFDPSLSVLSPYQLPYSSKIATVAVVVDALFALALKEVSLDPLLETNALRQKLHATIAQLDVDRSLASKLNFSALADSIIGSDPSQRYRSINR